MKRREFIALVGAAAVAWPIGASAQQPAKTPRIGALGVAPMTPSVAQAFIEGIGLNSTELTIEQRNAEGGRNCFPMLRPSWFGST
jgi:putative ABC transport system substrate-binding protein